MSITNGSIGIKAINGQLQLGKGLHSFVITGIFIEIKDIFDTKASSNPYPNISGTHNSTITPFYDLYVTKLYIYPCSGKGGHTEYVKIWNSTGWNVTAT